MDEQHDNGPFPRTPRPGSRTFSVCTGPYEISRTTRVGLDLVDVLEAELDDYRAGLKGAADPDAYALAEDDRAIWEGPRLLAVLKPRTGGGPDVFRFDEGQPRPATEDEHQAWAIVGEIGADEAIHRLTRPDLPPPPPPKPLTKAEEHALSAVRGLGEEEVLNRIYFAGPYEVIREAIGRLGWDAVAELRRVADVGERDRGIIARAAEALEVAMTGDGYERASAECLSTDGSILREVYAAINTARSILAGA